MGTVLIVDDEDSIRHAFGILITRKGHKAIKWPGSTGIDNIIKQTKPDIVLTDHNLNKGEEKGLALALRLRDEGIKVILMSSDHLIGRSAEMKGLPFYLKGDSTKKLFDRIKEVSHV